ncbi:class I SAM-dependent methyltransferase [Teredinibacter turnerae]|uniref:class I SAM-dependent methyltransferase n=1 Tax=Teredinibacter turnerae TaxID=2426 RepID=UPI0003732A53|nr:SAM-dependent methyltransferase [Teredinibacter turnerae]
MDAKPINNSKSKTNTKTTVADTAFWVASYRAKETLRPDALFHDPYAALLLDERTEQMARSMKPFAKYGYWSVTIRTPIIDDFILRYLQQSCNTVINLGAGLDTRPYRLDLPPETRWIEVDFPDVVALKNEKLHNETARCQLERIGLDLSNANARKNVFAELNNTYGPAILLTEGVTPYLTETDVIQLAQDLYQQPNFNYWINEYYSKDLYPRYQSPKFQRALGDAVFRFFPTDWFGLFEDNGWIKHDIHFLADFAAKHQRSFPLPWWVNLLKRLFGEDKITGKMREYSAYIVFEKKQNYKK